ncbi:MAG TPA: response regulator transcription factor [Rhizomicrobium sp.]|jgi:two-component system nitrate/nitrite response regulator NarL|nr:response regulator transcription factor [Rhizomicrobium sp.]
MRVVVADDHPLYRDAAVLQIQRLFPQARIDQVPSLDALRALAEQADTAFQLFLVDFHMPGMSVDALGQLAKRFPQVPIAVISGTAHRAEIRAMLQAGARGFIPKTATGDHLAHALQMLLAGGTSVPADMLFDEAGGDASTGWQDLLTQRERDVLRGVVRGLSNKEIGRELNLAEVTIKLHLRGVFRKMGARGRADAAVMATRAGFA